MSACRIKPEWDLSCNGERLIDWNRLIRGHEYSEDCPECSAFTALLNTKSEKELV